MYHFQDSLYFFPVFFRYSSTIMDYTVYRANRDTCHLGNVYNPNI